VYDPGKMVFMSKLLILDNASFLCFKLSGGLLSLSFFFKLQFVGSKNINCE